MEVRTSLRSIVVLPLSSYEVNKHNVLIDVVNWLDLTRVGTCVSEEQKSRFNVLHLGVHLRVSYKLKLLPKYPAMTVKLNRRNGSIKHMLFRNNRLG